MKESVLREIAALSFSSAADGIAARKYALESLGKKDLKKFMLYLKKEMRQRNVAVRTAGDADEYTKNIIAGVFEGRELSYETKPGLGAGLEIEHGDNIAKVNIQNILERAISGIKENL